MALPYQRTNFSFFCTFLVFLKMNNMKKVFLVSLLSMGLFSCASMFNGAVLPNQCKRCDLINLPTNEILWSIEGCGSENTRLEEQTQLKAYEMSRTSYG